MSISTRLLFSLLIAAPLISLSTPAQAARSYLIELVLFSMQDRGADEKWTAANPPLSSRKLARAKLPAQIMEEYKEEPVEIKESDFPSYVNRIRKNPRRNIILATHWVQTVLPPANTAIARITNRKDTAYGMKAGNSAIKLDINDAQTSSSRPVLDGFINFYIAGQ